MLCSLSGMALIIFCSAGHNIVLDARDPNDPDRHSTTLMDAKGEKRLTGPWHDIWYDSNFGNLKHAK